MWPDCDFKALSVGSRLLWQCDVKHWSHIHSLCWFKFVQKTVEGLAWCWQVLCYIRHWLSCASLMLHWIQHHLSFGSQCKANVKALSWRKLCVRSSGRFDVHVCTLFGWSLFYWWSSGAEIWNWCLELRHWLHLLKMMSCKEIKRDWLRFCLANNKSIII